MSFESLMTKLQGFNEDPILLQSQGQLSRQIVRSIEKIAMDQLRSLGFGLVETVSPSPALLFVLGQRAKAAN
jgi:hypothetical protein